MLADYKKATLDELSQKGNALGAKLALVGLDGFIDRIVYPVAQRLGLGANIVPFPSLNVFGERIVAAAGKSTSIELFLKQEQLGGNGPLMARALLATGASVRYVGSLGRPAIHPLFEDFARQTQAVSTGNPGVTNALEFTDGKLMLGEAVALEEISYARILETVGEAALLDLLTRADLVALVNWTQIPHMTEIFADLLSKSLPKLPTRLRHFFFDLADPAKRPRNELAEGLQTMARFQNFGQTTLGFNLAEAQQVAAVLAGDLSSPTPEKIQGAAEYIRQSLQVGCVVIHPVNGAACAMSDASWWVDGPVCEKPLITTGAGDHFNAGFMTGRLLGLPPPCCLIMGVITSGYYVRNAQSPTLGELAAFLGKWQDQEVN